MANKGRFRRFSALYKHAGKQHVNVVRGRRLLHAVWTCLVTVNQKNASLVPLAALSSTSSNHRTDLRPGRLTSFT